MSPQTVRPNAAPPIDASVRRILALALPALVVLSAEPIYILVDTAVVGHLGAMPLAALAVGGTLMTMVAWLGTVVAYGTTGRAARRFGAGDRTGAVAEGVQSSWLALTAGLLAVVVMQLAAGPIARLLVGSAGETADATAGWLRIAILGAPGLLLAAAGNGWMRGVQDTRRPMIFVVGPNLLSALLCPLLVYPLGLGLAGSAIANATAQTIGGLLFVSALITERVSLRPHPMMIRQQLALSRDLLIRGAAFQASFLSATAVASRFGTAVVGAHQIALQLWFFTSLLLDSLAIAAQSLVGAALGAEDAAAAKALAKRIARFGAACGIGFAVLIAAGAGILPGLFSTDAAVREQAMVAWPWFVAMMPLAGIVFALDGVLIGAGDVRYLRNLTIVATLGGFLPAVWLAYGLDLGLGGIWAGLTLLIVIRLVGALARMRSGRWAVIGATRV